MQTSINVRDGTWRKSSPLTKFLQFILGGILYCLLEIMWQGTSHFSMFIAGGAALLILNWLSNRGYSLHLSSLLGGIFITVIEFMVGYIVNIRMGLNVWDYSDKFLNFRGQICISYFMLWCALSFLVIYHLRRFFPSKRKLFLNGV